MYCKKARNFRRSQGRDCQRIFCSSMELPWLLAVVSAIVSSTPLRGAYMTVLSSVSGTDRGRRSRSSCVTPFDSVFNCCDSFLFLGRAVSRVIQSLLAVESPAPKRSSSRRTHCILIVLRRGLAHNSQHLARGQLLTSADVEMEF